MKSLIRLLLLVLPLVSAAQSSLPACTAYKHNCYGMDSFSNGEYVGEFKDGKYNGRGTYTFANGDKYVGEFKDGKRDGQGTYTHANGNKYVGEYKEDKATGQGTYTFANGNKYVGEFKDGKRNGWGTFILASGARHVGEWRDDLRNGQGIEYRADGTIIESGQWADGKLAQSFALDRNRFPFNAPTQTASAQPSPAAQSSLPPCPAVQGVRWHNCFGTYTFASGAKYVGEFKDDKYNGQGTYTFANGNKYVGEFRDSKYNGQGTLTLASGARHVGEWRDNLRNGQGIEYRADGTIIDSGRWADGNLAQSFAIDRSRFPFNAPTQTASAQPSPAAHSSLPPCPAVQSVRWHNCFGKYTFANGDEYVGEFKDDKYNGQGTYTFASGDKYVGEFKDSKSNGRGTYTFANGDKYVGEYKDDLRNGQGIEYRADGTIIKSGRWADGNLAQSFVLDRSRFPFDAPSQAIASNAESGRAERDRLVAEVDAARKRQRELEAELEAERRRRVESGNRSKGQARSTGTGFSVAPGVIVTNQHVVAGCRSLEVLSTDGRRASRVVDADELVDLALLRVTGLGGGVAPIRRIGSVRLGEPAYAFGFPLTGLLSESGNFTGGTVSSLRGLRDSASQIQISTPVQPGNSGGALVDASGSVIGVVVGKLNASALARATGDIPQNVNFAVSLQALSDFLMKNNVPVRTVDRRTATDTAELADLMRGFTHRVECLD